MTPNETTTDERTELEYYIPGVIDATSGPTFAGQVVRQFLSSL